MLHSFLCRLLVVLLTVAGLEYAAAVPGPSAQAACQPTAYSQTVYVHVPFPALSDGTVHGALNATPVCTGYRVFAFVYPGDTAMHGGFLLSGADDSAYSYTPGTFIGTDSIAWCLVLQSVASPTMSDCTGTDSGPYRLSFLVGAAIDDHYTTPANTELDVGVIGTVDPLYNDPLARSSAAVATQPAHGTLLHDGQGGQQFGYHNWSAASFGYVPNAGFVGTDSFTYCDAFEGSTNNCDPTTNLISHGVTVPFAAHSNLATVFITVTGASARITTPTSRFTLATTAQISWSGQSSTAINHYELRQRRASWNGHFGPWSTPASWSHLAPGSPHTKASLAAGTDSCFSVRLVDSASQPSPWSTPSCTARPLDDRGLALATGGWSRSGGAGFYLATITSTSQSGRRLSRSGAVFDRLALVATRCPTCGEVAVRVGSTLIAIINLHAARTYRQSLILLPHVSLRTATVTLTSVNSGRPVQIDGLGISQE